MIDPARSDARLLPRTAATQRLHLSQSQGVKHALPDENRQSARAGSSLGGVAGGGGRNSDGDGLETRRFQS
jgi:hypothetical protein